MTVSQLSLISLTVNRRQLHGRCIHLKSIEMLRYLQGLFRVQELSVRIIGMLNHHYSGLAIPVVQIVSGCFQNSPDVCG